MKRVVISVFLTALMLTSVSYAAVVPYGQDINTNEKTYTQTFSDVPTEHWAFKYVEDLVERKAINGYPDGNFYPDKTVTREEFAKIMVIAAGLTATPAQVSSYIDVPLEYWASPFIETARPYMTAYQAQGGFAFYPTTGALREDIAVAVVKLKGYDTRLADLSMIQTMFTDVDAISEAAKPYVALAVENGIISGYVDHTFRGQNTITRSEAAAILWRAFQYGNDRKVIADDTIPATPSPSAVSTDAPASVEPPVLSPQVTSEPTPTPEPTPETTPEPESTKPYAVDTLVRVNVKDPELLMTTDSENHVIYYDSGANEVKSLDLASGEITSLLEVNEVTYTSDEIYGDLEISQLFWDSVDGQLLISGTFTSTNNRSDNGWTLQNPANKSFRGIFAINEGRLTLFSEHPMWEFSIPNDRKYYFDCIKAVLSNGDFIVQYSDKSIYDYKYCYIYQFDTGHRGSLLTWRRDYPLIVQYQNAIYGIQEPYGYSISILQTYDLTSEEWKQISTLPELNATWYQNGLFYTWSTDTIYATRPADGAYQVKLKPAEDVEVLDLRVLPQMPAKFMVTTDEQYIFYDNDAKAIRVIRPASFDV